MTKIFQLLCFHVMYSEMFICLSSLKKHVKSEITSGRSPTLERI